MHFLLYVCLPTSEAKTSLQARKRVFCYLCKENFVHNGRFGGLCDYFLVGGRYSGMLNMLRLKHHHPRKYTEYLTQTCVGSGLKAKEVYKIFKKCFPKHEGMNPFIRDNFRVHGYPDDAQIIDEVLFAELKSGFSDYVSCAHPFNKPNVIFTDLCEDEWPSDAKSGVGRHWVVVIDYHD